MSGHSLTVAMAEPANLLVIDELKRITSCDVHVVAATASDIRRLVQACIPSAGVFVIDDILDLGSDTDLTLVEEAVEDVANLQGVAGQSPVIRLVNYFIYNAVKDSASDIHW